VSFILYQPNLNNPHWFFFFERFKINLEDLKGGDVSRMRRCTGIRAGDVPGKNKMEEVCKPLLGYLTWSKMIMIS